MTTSDEGDAEAIEDVGPSGPVDVPAASLEDDDDDPLPNFRRRNRVIGISMSLAIALTGALIGLHIGAGYQRDQAWRLVSEGCTNDWPDDLERCRLPPMRLASLWPTTRRAIAKFRNYADYDTDLAIARRAASVELDTDVHAAAVARMLEVGPLHSFEQPSRDLHEAGAHEALVKLAEVPGVELGWQGPGYAARSALLLGRYELRAELLGRSTDGGSVEAAAWLCLFEPQAAGAARVREIIDEWRERFEADSRVDLQRLVLVACQASDGPPTILTELELGDPIAPRMQAWLVAREAARGRRSASAWLDAQPAAAVHLAPVLAQAVLHEQPTAEVLAGWIAPEPDEELGERTLPFTSTQLLAGRGMLVMRANETDASFWDPAVPRYDPAGMLAAARRLAELAESSTSSPPPTDAADPTRISTALRRGAAVLASQAALEWLTRGRWAEAVDAARFAQDQLAPEDAWIVQGVRVLAGDSQAVLDWIAARRRATPAPDAGETDILLEIEIRARAQLGDWERARELANAPRDSSEAVEDHRRYLDLWQLALDLRTGTMPHWADRFYEPAPASLEWYAWLATEPEIARRERADFGNGVPTRRYTDLYLHLMAAVAHDPGPDAEELWLDLLITKSGPIDRVYFYARAEVARWRGDTEHEAIWRSRLDDLLALASTEERALLLSAAEL